MGRTAFLAHGAAAALVFLLTSSLLMMSLCNHAPTRSGHLFAFVLLVLMLMMTAGHPLLPLLWAAGSSLMASRETRAAASGLLDMVGLPEIISAGLYILCTLLAAAAALRLIAVAARRLRDARRRMFPLFLFCVPLYAACFLPEVGLLMASGPAQGIPGLALAAFALIQMLHGGLMLRPSR